MIQSSVLEITAQDIGEDSITPIERIQYAVFVHQDTFASPDAIDGTAQLGGYFRNGVHLKAGLDAWGNNGWLVPDIAIAWEQFGNEGNAGFRIRNAGAPVIHEERMSAVIAVRKLAL